MKRKLCLALAVVMLFTSITVFGTSAEEAAALPEANQVTTVGSEEIAYNEYLAKVEDFSGATNKIVVDAVDYISSKGATLEKVDTFEGKDTVLKWTNEAGTVLYEFDVPADGLYTVMFDYYALPKRNNPISLGMKIDGKALFDSMLDFEIPRIFVDDGEIRVDGIGNEFAPAQVEHYAFQQNYFKDPSSILPEPYTLALTKGKHTLEISSLAEPFALNEIVFGVPAVIEDYDTVSSNYDESKYATIKDAIKIEGEEADFKSTYSLVPQYDQGDPSVSSKNGSDPYKTRINYMGDLNWKAPGEKITWKFSVPESGYYKIGMRYKQNLVVNGISYRKLTIDGVQPFTEAGNIGFEYGLDWEYKQFGDDEGNPYLVYLKEGEHLLSMEVVLGDLTQPINDLIALMFKVGNLYRKMVMITGSTPDTSRDYELFKQIPGFLEMLQEYSDELERIAVETEKLAGKTGGTNAASLRAFKVIIDEMINHKHSAHQYMSSYFSNYTSVSALAYSMMEMAVNIDYFEIAAPDYKFTNPSVSGWKKAIFGIERFLASFSANYNKVSGSAETKDTVTIWANWGRDQIRVLNNLIESSFTPSTGIGVNLQLSNATYVQAILSGRGPDCSLNMARTSPVDLALRGAMVDLKQFDYYNPETREITEEYTGDFSNTIKRFKPDGANPKMNPTLPYTFQDGIYAMPDTYTFNMLFYRTDIFEEYGLKCPTTWDEYIEVSSIFYRNNLEACMPNSTTVDTGILPTLIMQMGGDIYNENLSGTLLATGTSIKAFEFWTDFYTQHGFPITAEFYNRFKLGIMPMGIQPYTLYIQLEMAAKEVNGKWKMVPIPGYKNEDGTVNNVQAGAGTGCGILKIAKKPKLGWEFLKWWTSADTQLRYSNNCESILGVAGRIPTSNVEALTKMGWTNETVKQLLAQIRMIQEVPEVPGSYYTSRAIYQAYWNVVSNGKNPKDMLIKWAEVADSEIERKREQYGVK